MSHMRWRLALLTGGLPALTLAAPGGNSATKALPAEQLTKEEFQRLPDDAVIEVGGKHRTKAEIQEEVKRLERQVEDELRSAAPAKAPDLTAVQAQIRAQEDAEIAARDAQVKAFLEDLKRMGRPKESPELRALRLEVRRVLNRARSPLTAVERADLDKRVEELFQRLGGLAK